MAVPDQRHIVVHIEIGAPRVVVEVLHPAPHNFQRTLVGNAEIFPQQSAALFKRLLKTRFLRGKTIRGNSQQKIWIG